MSNSQITTDPDSIPDSWKIAARIYLIITLISGTLLRYQWTGHSSPVFDSRYLLHAHSHIALLGWTFFGIFGLILAKSRLSARGFFRFGGEIVIHVVIIGMFIAFLFQGYAFWSILLSMLHILITFALIFYYTRSVRSTMTPDIRSWIDLSMFWLVFSTIGPWMLSLGGMMGTDWITFWVSFYLTIMFNGWLTFAVIGLLIMKLNITLPTWTRDLLFISVIPVLLARSHDLISFPGMNIIGWIGSAFYGVGLITTGFYLFRHRRFFSNASDSLLFHFILAGAVLTGICIILAGFPVLAHIFQDSRMAMIGFIHLQLLGFISAGLLLMIFRLRLISVILFLTGSWVMILLLLLAGILPVLGITLFWPLQWIFTFCGLLMITALLFPGRKDFNQTIETRVSL